MKRKWSGRILAQSEAPQGVVNRQVKPAGIEGQDHKAIMLAKPPCLRILCIDNYGEDAKLGTGRAFQGVGEEDAAEAAALVRSGYGETPE